MRCKCWGWMPRKGSSSVQPCWETNPTLSLASVLPLRLALSATTVWWCQFSLQVIHGPVWWNLFRTCRWQGRSWHFATPLTRQDISHGSLTAKASLPIITMATHPKHIVNRSCEALVGAQHMEGSGFWSRWMSWVKGLTCHVPIPASSWHRDMRCACASVWEESCGSIRARLMPWSLHLHCRRLRMGRWLRTLSWDDCWWSLRKLTCFWERL